MHSGNALMITSLGHGLEPLCVDLDAWLYTSIRRRRDPVREQPTPNNHLATAVLCKPSHLIFTIKLWQVTNGPKGHSPQ